jgi:plastocyanin
MRRASFGAVVAAVTLACPAIAADLDVQIRGPDVKPVRDAVVTVRLIGRATPPAKAAGTYAIDQQGIQFHPFVTIVPVGASVMFMNHDDVRHHVYSFSPAKTFQLKLEKREQNSAVTFDKPGIVPLGCNIHDRMIAYVAVVDTPWARISDASGHVLLRALPAGAVEISVWHPYLRSPGNRITRNTSVSDGAPSSEQIAVTLRPPPRMPESGY